MPTPGHGMRMPCSRQPEKILETTPPTAKQFGKSRRRRILSAPGPRASLWPVGVLVAVLLLAPVAVASAAAPERAAGSSSPAGVGAVIQNITVGKSPTSIALDSSNGDLFVADTFGDNLTVLSTSSESVVGSVALPYPSPPAPANYSQPVDDIFDAATGDVLTSLLLASSSITTPAGTISVVDGATKANVTAFPLLPIQSQGGGGPLAIDTATGDVWVGSYNDDNVTSYNPTSGAVTGTPVDNYMTGNNFTPQGLCYDASTNAMYVAQESTYGPSSPGNVLVLSGGGSLLSTIPIPAGGVTGCAVDPDNGDVYVQGTTYNADIYIIDGATNAIIQNISLPSPITSEPIALCFDSQNAYVYLLDQGNYLTAIDGATNNILGSMVLGPTVGSVAFPSGLVFDSANGYLYITVKPPNGVTDGWVSVVNPKASGSSGSLTSVSISGIPNSLALGSSATLTAVPSCTGGACPSGVGYSWSLIGTTLGTLSSTTTATTTFTAGSVSGAQSISVIATLNGAQALGDGALIIGSGGTGSLLSVSIGGIPSSVMPNATITLTATPSCTTGGCPSGIAFSWQLLGSTLGSLGTTTGAAVLFTAGSVQGTQQVQVSASHNGTWKNVTGSIVISSSGGGSSPPSDNGWILWVALAGGVAAAAIVGVVVALKVLPKRRAPSPPNVPPSTYVPPPTYPPPSPPR